MTINSNSQKLLVALGTHTLFLLLTYMFFIKFGHHFLLPSNENVLQYDAVWYRSIENQGYVYQPGQGNNMAFFPFFPLFWKWTSLTPLGICGLNYIMFAVAFYFLLKSEKLTLPSALILLSFPSCIFFALPYSESLFFSFSTLIIVGLKSNNEYLVYTGLFFSSLVRSVCMLFIPILFIMEIFNFMYYKDIGNSLDKLFCRLFVNIAGFFVASAYMAYNTGRWFYFIEIQKYWHRKWQLLKLPFTTSSPRANLGLDAVTLMIGCFAIVICLLWLYNLIKNRNRISSNVALPGSSVLFSTFFIVGMCLLDAFYTKYTDNSTNLWSLNRHVMCTPFAFVFLIYLVEKLAAVTYVRYLYAILVFAGVFFLGVYRYFNFPVFGFYVLFFVNVCVFAFVRPLQKFFYLFYVVLLFFQVTLYSNFLSGIWIG